MYMNNTLQSGHIRVYTRTGIFIIGGGEVDAVDLFGLRDHTGGAGHHGGLVIHGTDF